MIVLDEASMVDEVLYKDLCSYGLPILAVGDHGQLPPVQGALNLMASPAIRLEKIHRQAADNPIVQMSLRAREGRGILTGDYGAVRKVTRRRLPEILERYGADFDAAGMVLCGTNNTRASSTSCCARAAASPPSCPQPGERVICLRNSREQASSTA
jgi:exodeoxyribonuclease-5